MAHAERFGTLPSPLQGRALRQRVPQVSNSFGYTPVLTPFRFAGWSVVRPRPPGRPASLAFCEIDPRSDLVFFFFSSISAPGHDCAPAAKQSRKHSGLCPFLRAGQGLPEHPAGPTKRETPESLCCVPGPAQTYCATALATRPCRIRLASLGPATRAPAPGQTNRTIPAKNYKHPVRYQCANSSSFLNRSPF